MRLNPGDIALDYSSARPTPLAIVGAGVKLVMRYISPRRDHQKNLTPAERDSHLEAGLGLGLVWENAQTDPLKGAGLGKIHGEQAGSFAYDLGNPAGQWVVAACDTDTTQKIGGRYVSVLPPMMDYLHAFHDACGFPMGAYGNDVLVTAAYEAGISVLGWQATGWSGGRISPYAHCFQHYRIIHPSVNALLAYGSIDDNTVLQPFEAWSKDTSPTQPVPQEDELNPNRFVLATDNSIWEVGTDRKGSWAQRVGDPSRPIAWELYNPAQLNPGEPPIDINVLNSLNRPPEYGTGGTASIDYDKLANMVADVVHKRMES